MRNYWALLALSRRQTMRRRAGSLASRQLHYFHAARQGASTTVDALSMMVRVALIVPTSGQA
jgi:hypothetical protein